MTPTQQIGKRVRTLRRRRQWTQTDLGDRIGWHKTNISNLETGRIPGISLATLFRLARALRVAPTFLIRGLK